MSGHTTVARPFFCVTPPDRTPAGTLLPVKPPALFTEGLLQ